MYRRTKSPGVPPRLPGVPPLGPLPTPGTLNSLTSTIDRDSFESADMTPTSDHAAL